MKDEDERLNPGADTQGTGGAGANPKQHGKGTEDLTHERDKAVYAGTARDGVHREEDPKKQT
ncbi:hypothetical protein WSK_1539 [Novosphingobium sp. Rr 2-17]|uniref:hypothetical protein n=1 Tax=Novosphingobium sp. Rr 2-17 TaxID=555793 RepID=UPI000269950A|nr:hypothetical protein [Novosphingobium sp. Rr 2-17]EIZ79863.1 hypothetical protein WSK_1539 [Novosphingobium sp. Rr 2-17]